MVLRQKDPIDLARQRAPERLVKRVLVSPLERNRSLKGLPQHRDTPDRFIKRVSLWPNRFVKRGERKEQWQRLSLNLIKKQIRV